MRKRAKRKTCRLFPFFFSASNSLSLYLPPTHTLTMEAPLARGGAAPTYTRIGEEGEEEGGGDVASLKAALVHEGFPTLAAAARTRAAAVYYGFGMLSLGFLIVLVFAL
jgi:hypothetical protein